MTDPCISLPGAPEDYHHLKQLIASRQLSFPGKLDRIARFMLENPYVVAFESSRTLAERCGVSPTSVARFVRHVGFTDFRALKVLFQGRLKELADGRSVIRPPTDAAMIAVLRPAHAGWGAVGYEVAGHAAHHSMDERN